MYQVACSMSSASGSQFFGVLLCGESYTQVFSPEQNDNLGFKVTRRISPAMGGSEKMICARSYTSCRIHSRQWISSAQFFRVAEIWISFLKYWVAMLLKIVNFRFYIGAMLLKIVLFNESTLALLKIVNLKQEIAFKLNIVVWGRCG